MNSSAIYVRAAAVACTEIDGQRARITPGHGAKNAITSFACCNRGRLTRPPRREAKVVSCMRVSSRNIGRFQSRPRMVVQLSVSDKIAVIYNIARYLL